MDDFIQYKKDLNEFQTDIQIKMFENKYERLVWEKPQPRSLYLSTFILPQNKVSLYFEKMKENNALPVRAAVFQRGMRFRLVYKNGAFSHFEIKSNETSVFPVVCDSDESIYGLKRFPRCLKTDRFTYLNLEAIFYIDKQTVIDENRPHTSIFNKGEMFSKYQSSIKIEITDVIDQEGHTLDTVEEVFDILREEGFEIANSKVLNSVKEFDDFYNSYNELSPFEKIFYSGLRIKPERFEAREQLGVALDYYRANADVIFDIPQFFVEVISVETEPHKLLLNSARVTFKFKEPIHIGYRVINEMTSIQRKDTAKAIEQEKVGIITIDVCTHDFNYCDNHMSFKGQSGKTYVC